MTKRPRAATGSARTTMTTAIARFATPADAPMPHRLEIVGPDEMTALGRRLSAILAPGEVVLLSGPLGAGKSHLARAIVRARLGDPGAEVPSPTYTLVNVYDTATGEIWHADLYRLSDPGDLHEIGLDDALSHAITLVEWPERWADPPARRLEIAIAVTPENSVERRTVTLRPRGDWPGLAAALRSPG